MVAAGKSSHNLRSTVFLSSWSLTVTTYLPVLVALAVLATALDAAVVSIRLSPLGPPAPVASLLTFVLSHTLVLFHTLSLSFKGHQFYCLSEVFAHISNYPKEQDCVFL